MLARNLSQVVNTAYRLNRAGCFIASNVRVSELSTGRHSRFLCSFVPSWQPYGGLICSDCTPTEAYAKQGQRLPMFRKAHTRLSAASIESIWNSFQRFPYVQDTSLAKAILLGPHPVLCLKLKKFNLRDHAITQNGPIRRCRDLRKWLCRRMRRRLACPLWHPLQDP